MADKIDVFASSDLPDKYKVALELADALMTMPSSIDSRLRDDLRAHFGAEQVLELTLDVMKWSYQKVSVALGTDAEVRAGQLTEYEFDAEGRAVI